VASHGLGSQTVSYRFTATKGGWMRLVVTNSATPLTAAQILNARAGDAGVLALFEIDGMPRAIRLILSPLWFIAVYLLLAAAAAAVAPALTAARWFPVASSVGREALWPLQAVLVAARRMEPSALAEEPAVVPSARPEIVPDFPSHFLSP
jgi:hypothetical protein